MKNDEKKVSFFRQYVKTIVASIIFAFNIGFIVPWWIAVDKLNSIKAGEYPDMPQDQINKQYDEALPSVILESIVMFLVIAIVVSIPILLLRFKQNHDINLLSEFTQYLRKRKQ